MSTKLEAQMEAAWQALLRLGGSGKINDIRKAAGLKDQGGDRIAQAMIRAGMLRRDGHDLYRVLPKK